MKSLARQRLVLLAQLLCPSACLLSLLRSAKPQECLEESCVRRGIRGVKAQCLLVGMHCIVVAAEVGKDVAHAHVGSGVRRECHCLLKGSKSFIVARQGSKCIALASESS